MNFGLKPNFQLLVLFRIFRVYRPFPIGNGTLKGGGQYTVCSGRHSLLFLSKSCLINCYYVHSERFQVLIYILNSIFSAVSDAMILKTHRKCVNSVKTLDLCVPCFISCTECFVSQWINSRTLIILHSCVLYISQSGYLWVSVEHFDSLRGDEEIHLCHWLRLTLRGLHTHIYTTKVTKQY